jgi:hypothetical protein
VFVLAAIHAAYPQIVASASQAAPAFCMVTSEPSIMALTRWVVAE